jgi:hypothetical protein
MYISYLGLPYANSGKTESPQNFMHSILDLGRNLSNDTTYISFYATVAKSTS